MYVTDHARSRLTSRLGDKADALASVLETWEGERGTLAYIVADLPEPVEAGDGSNGDLLVIVVVDGSVETVYFRRSTQDLSPEFFGAEKVVDKRSYPLHTGGRMLHSAPSVRLPNQESDILGDEWMRRLRVENTRKLHSLARREAARMRSAAYMSGTYVMADDRRFVPKDTVCHCGVSTARDGHIHYPYGYVLCLHYEGEASGDCPQAGR